MRKKYYLALLAAIFAAPTGRTNISIKAVTSGSGKGSIEVVAGEDEWNYEWEELTDEVKDTVKTIGKKNPDKITFYRFERNYRIWVLKAVSTKMALLSTTCPILTFHKSPLERYAEKIVDHYF